jgi:hypothetical protein
VLTAGYRLRLGKLLELLSPERRENFVGNLGRFLTIRIDLKRSTPPIKWLSLGQEGLDFGPSAVISQVRTPRGGRCILVNPFGQSFRRGPQPDNGLALGKNQAVGFA